MTGRARPTGRWLLRPGVRTGARSLAVISAALLVVSALGLSAITAGIDVAPTSIGRPEHPGNEAFGADRRAPIPRAAFEAVRAIPTRGPIAFGGDRVYDLDLNGTSYRVHEFTTVGPAEFVLMRPITVDYLVVGGGGSGTRGECSVYYGQGGGGGGVAQGSAALTPGTVDIAVGAGGAGSSTATCEIPHTGTEGVSSSVSGQGLSILAGGGLGAQSTQATGGSSGTVTVNGQVTAAQDGGTGSGGGFPAGGGGGAGGPGSGINGGPGITSEITGQSVTYGAGGAGRSSSGFGQPGEGPAGVGGGGSDSATAGLAFHPGGAGAVILRYQLPRSAWTPVTATGGTVTEYVADGTNGAAGMRYRVHTFTASDTFQVTDPGSDGTVEVLLVGGGGGGGTRHGGGGGGGGVLRVPDVSVAQGPHSIVVGQGGAGATAATAAANGSASSALGLSALGGGRGASAFGAAGGGGSGGGSNATGAVVGAGGAGQGNAGGAGASGTCTLAGNEPCWAGGGGGGAGGPGTAGTGGSAVAIGGDGGPGRAENITGTSVIYGGGGGGSVSHRASDVGNGRAGRGGSGGGGAGASLGWELYDTAQVGRGFSWRLFTHNRAHPTDEAGLDQFFSGNPLRTGATTNILSALNWTTAAGLYEAIGSVHNQNPIDRFAFEITGWFIPTETGTYHFTVASDDAADVRIGSTTVTGFYGGRGVGDLGVTQGSIGLTAGVAYAFRARMEEGTGGEALRVYWRKPSQAAGTWQQDAAELLGNTPLSANNSPASRVEFDRYLAAGRLESNGLGTVTTQTHGVAEAQPNTLNWEKSSDNSVNQLSSSSVIGVAGLANDFAVVTSGTFHPSETGTYTFSLSGDDAVDLFINGQPVVSHYGQKGAPALGTHTGTISLTAGQPVALQVRHHQRDGGAVLRLFWRAPSQTTGWHQNASELSSVGHAGVNGLGGGGGAGGFSGSANAAGGRGGDGVVVVRYPVDRLLTALPSQARSAIAGEAAGYALVRWTAPALAPPAANLGGYRIERAPVGGSQWTNLTDGVTFTTAGDVITAQITGLDPATRHQFRITPLGSVDGPSLVVASAGKGGDVVTFVGDDVVHQYTSVGASEFRLGADRTVRHLVVGGGAAGASGRGGGGGGAGGVRRGVEPMSPGVLAVTVGAGGVGVGSSAGADGQSSSFAAHTALGGGGGNWMLGEDGRAGASGGGSRHNSGRSGGAGNPGQGHAGGSGVANGYVGGGGGGAGGAGLNGATSGANTGAGGPGITDDITGVPEWYAAGGGGGGTDNRVSTLSNAGQGGGGRGARDSDAAGDASTPGSGGGGGGSTENLRGGNGANGIVILRYAAVQVEPVLATGGDSVYFIQSEGVTYRVHEFRTVGTHTLAIPGELTLEYLVVGGGGGGGTGWDGAPGGGGGAGGLRDGSVSMSVGTDIAVSVGAGGAGGSGGQGFDNPSVAGMATRGRDGSPSSFSDFVVPGGGGGGEARANGSPGGSGGGGGGRHNIESDRTGGTVTLAGAGNPGGGSRSTGASGAGGGGGGGAAGAGGSTNGTSAGGLGGLGATSSITGNEVVYAAGGSGGTFGVASDVPGAHASVTGGGGGGGSKIGQGGVAGGNGADGIVIVRYAMPWWYVP